MTREKRLAWIDAVASRYTNHMAVRIAVIISRHVGDDGFANKSLMSLAAETGLHRRSFQRALAEMEWAGLIEITRADKPGVPSQLRPILIKSATNHPRALCDRTLRPEIEED